MGQIIKTAQVGNMRFLFVEETDPITMHTQITIYAAYYNGLSELQKGFQINEFSQAANYFDALVRDYKAETANG